MKFLFYSKNKYYHIKVVEKIKAVRKKLFGGLDKLKSMVNRNNEDYEFYENELEEMVLDDGHTDTDEQMFDEPELEVQEEVAQPNPSVMPKRRSGGFSLSKNKKSFPSTDSATLSSRFPSNVVGLPGVNLAMNEIEIFSPHTFKQASQVIQILKQQRSVVLNLNLMEPYEAQRAVDFVTGGVCALDGHYDRVGECVFIFTPRGVKITNSEGDSSIEPSTQENKENSNTLSGSYSESLWDIPLPELSNQLAT